MSEHHVRERKSNAQKQFAYNKLKNEQFKTSSSKSSPSKHDPKSVLVPKRPPQPKSMNFEKKDKEGMLIDLTSPQSQDVPAAVSNGLFALNLNGMSILDAPIDVPTEYPGSELNSIEMFTSVTDSSSKLEPPPYQSPPTYMNTYGLSQTTSNYAAGPSMEHSQYRNIDPFDTSHIGSSQKSQTNAYSALSSPSHSYQNSELTKLDGNFIRNQIDGIEGASIAIARPKSAAVAQLDEMVQNKIAQLSPKSSSKYSTTKAYVDSSELNFSIDNSISIKNSTANDTSLNDSLKVNLSTLTLNDTGELELQSMPSTSDDRPKLDRAFLAELEKTIYKNDISVSNVNVNTTQSNDFQQTNAKDNTVRSIPSNIYSQGSMNWLQNGISNGSSSSSAAAGASSSSSANSYQSIGTVSIHSPAKYKNNDTIKMTNYESSASINAQPMTLSKKLYNTEISSIDYSPTTTNVNQINSNYANASNNQQHQHQQHLYSNYTMTNALINNIPSNGTVHESKQHNFVAQSNQKLPSVYNTVKSDIYGGNMAGATGNVYDIVASSNNDAYYQMIQSNEPTTVIYDEVAGDEIRPHRPAPGPPPAGTILSAQQIQRRLERAQKGQQQLYGNLNGSTYANSSYAIANHSTYEEIQNPNSQQEIYSFIKELPDDATEQEAKDALNASNWDHNQAVRHFKIERLMR